MKVPLEDHFRYWEASFKYNFCELQMLFYGVRVHQVCVPVFLHGEMATCHQPGIADSFFSEDILNMLMLSESPG